MLRATRVGRKGKSGTPGRGRRGGPFETARSELGAGDDHAGRRASHAARATCRARRCDLRGTRGTACAIGRDQGLARRAGIAGFAGEHAQRGRLAGRSRRSGRSRRPGVAFRTLRSLLAHRTGGPLRSRWTGCPLRPCRTGRPFRAFEATGKRDRHHASQGNRGNTHGFLPVILSVLYLLMLARECETQATQVNRCLTKIRPARIKARGRF